MVCISFRNSDCVSIYSNIPPFPAREKPKPIPSWRERIDFIFQPTHKTCLLTRAVLLFKVLHLSDMYNKCWGQNPQVYCFFFSYYIFSQAFFVYNDMRQHGIASSLCRATKSLTFRGVKCVTQDLSISTISSLSLFLFSLLTSGCILSTGPRKLNTHTHTCWVSSCVTDPDDRDAREVPLYIIN